MPLPSPDSASAAPDTYRHRGQRRALVAALRGRGLRDEQVLAALGAVPRHLFFAPAFEAHAYHDKAFPIGEGQTISQPYTVAYQTELLAVAPHHRVLEVGTGSGYQCAVLLRLTPHVHSIELNATLFAATQRRLGALLPPAGPAPRLRCGDGSLGWPEAAPFDRILVTAGAPGLPPALLRQLAVGGQLVIPVGPAHAQRMVRVVREGPDAFAREDLAPARFAAPAGGRRLAVSIEPNVTAFPTYFLLDPQGVVVVRATELGPIEAKLKTLVPAP